MNVIEKDERYFCSFKYIAEKFHEHICSYPDPRKVSCSIVHCLFKATGLSNHLVSLLHVLTSEAWALTSNEIL